jgi:hypothetical protein
VNELAVENVFGIRGSVLEDRPQWPVDDVTFGFIYNLVIVRPLRKLCIPSWKFVPSIEEKPEVNVFLLAKGMLTLVRRYLYGGDRHRAVFWVRPAWQQNNKRVYL